MVRSVVKISCFSERGLKARRHNRAFLFRLISVELTWRAGLVYLLFNFSIFYNIVGEYTYNVLLEISIAFVATISILSGTADETNVVEVRVKRWLQDTYVEEHIRLGN